MLVLAVAASGSVVAAAGLGRELPDEGQDHVADGTRVPYRHYPPASGPHWPARAAWGVAEQEVPPEVWVHNLEHGGIVVLYRCDAPCPDLVAQLRGAQRTFPTSKHGQIKLLVVQDRRIGSRLAVLAWRRVWELETFDRERLLGFYRTYVDRGPEDAP